MKIRGWHIENFGRFSNYVVTDLPDGLLVVLGPNEAGKSTLNAFIQGVLFKFPARNAKDERRLIHENLSIGQLQIEVEGLRYTVVRKNAARQPVLVRGPAGSEGDDKLLSQLLSGADSSLFCSIFSFGLRQLQDIETLNKEKVRDKLFAAAMGTGRISPTKAVETLEAASALLYKESGSTSAQSRLRVLVEESNRLRQQLSIARTLAKEFPLIEAQEVAARKKLDQLRDMEIRLRDEQRACFCLIELFPETKKLDDLRDSVAKLPNMGSLSIEADRELTERSTVCKETKLAREGAETDLQQARMQAEHLVYDAPLLEVATQLEPLFAELPIQRDRGARIKAAEYDIAMLRQTLDTQLERLGGDWTEQQLDSWTRKASYRSLANEWQLYLERSRNNLALAERSEKAALEAIVERESDAGRCSSKLAQIEPLSRESIAEKHASLQRFRSLQDAMRATQSEERDHDTQLRELARMAMPMARSSLRLLFIGVAIAIIGAVVSAIVGLKIEMFVALGVAAVLVAVAVLKYSGGEIPLGDSLAVAPETRRNNAASLESMRAEVSRAAVALGLSVLASQEELSKIDTLLAEQREQRMEYDNRLKQIRAAEDAVERAKELAALAARDLQNAESFNGEQEAAWAEIARQMGLGKITPIQALTNIEIADGAKEFLERLRLQQSSLDKDRALSASWTEMARSALTRIGAEEIKLGEDLDAVNRLAQTVREQRDVARQRDEAELRCIELDRRFSMARVRDEEAHAALLGFLNESGCTTEEEFHEKFKGSVERAELADRIASLELLLDAKLSTLADPVAARANLENSSPDAWVERGGRIEEEFKAAALEREECAKQQNRLSEQREKLSTDDEIASLDLQRSSIVAQTVDVTREWFALRLAARLIRKTKEQYERERQPAVIASAGPIFEMLTRGHYTSILQREGGDGFDLLDKSGRRWRDTDLSQGTLEQLYLSLRLALAQEFAQGKGLLPLIMDDVLVNFDPERAAAVADVLREVAKTRQVIVFTCHPWVRDVLLPEDDCSREITLGS